MVRTVQGYFFSCLAPVTAGVSFFAEQMLTQEDLDALSTPRHIGDGVYVSFNGFSIEIRVNDHRNPPVVMFEPDVAQRFIEYFEKLKNDSHSDTNG